MKQALYSIFALCTLAFVACNQDDPIVIPAAPELPDVLFNYSEPETSTNFWLNQQLYDVTDAGATLGRVLFYDKILSLNNKVSCASCHAQENAFADPIQFSRGIDDQVLSRHTMAIGNLYDDVFLFWDGRSNSLEDLALRPVRNHKEMGLDNSEFLIEKIKRASYYTPLFEDAYGDQEISRERVADALAQFVKSMVTSQSKYDNSMAGVGELTSIEQQGFNLFFGEAQCYQCHSGLDFNSRGGFFIDPIFPGQGWGLPEANIGLDEDYEDEGMGTIDSKKKGIFKIPSLRNIALTAPYMHDGRFATLEEVINHYNKGIQDHPNLDVVLRDWATSEPRRIGLDDSEVQALKSFLMTLTDEQFINDPKFSNPFN